MIHAIARLIQVVAAVGCVSSCAYYLLCLWGAGSFLAERKSSGAVEVASLLPVSILKPLKGIDPEIYESFRSYCLQEYPEYEIIFGVSEDDDPALASVVKLQREFPNVGIRSVVCSEKLGTNVKVSNLEQMLRHARYELLIVNDSDIRVEPDYLRRVMSPLGDEKVGMVTCLYRGVASETLASKFESLGISTDFSAGVLAARKLEGGVSFGLGSTLAFRRADLGRIGGFISLVDYLADDYELGRRIAGLGLRVHLSEVVVETHLPAYDWKGFVSHQLRWARGVRDARAGGYVGMVTTFGLMWSLLLVCAAQFAPWSWVILSCTLALRFAVAFVVGRSVLRDAELKRSWWLIPVRDLIGVGVWIASFAANTVMWRGDRFELKQGRLRRIAG